MCCDVFVFNIDNGDGFYNDGYDDWFGFGVGDKYGGLGQEEVVCVCDILVVDVTNLSTGVVSEAVIQSAISFSISESFILGGIGGGCCGTWTARGFFLPGVEGGRVDCEVFCTCL